MEVKGERKWKYICINNFAKLSIRIILSFIGKTTSSLEKNNNELVKPLKFVNLRFLSYNIKLTNIKSFAHIIPK